MAAEKSSSKKKSGPKVMDVAKPGKSAPAATSRPVIVGHRPMVQDPMMNDPSSKPKAITVKGDEPTPKVPEASPQLAHSKVIAPLSKDIKPEEPADEPPKDIKPAIIAPDPVTDPESPTSEAKDASPAIVDEPAPEEPAKTTPEADDTPAEEPAEEKPSESEVAPSDDATSAKSDEPQDDTAQTESTDSGVVDAVAEQAGAKKQQSKADEEAKKRQEAIDKLIAEKKYFLPTSQVTHRRQAHGALALLLLLIIGALAFVYVIDAGIVDLGIDLPFDLIKN